MVEKILVTPREFAVQISKRRGTKGLAVISICSSKKDILFTKAVKKQLTCDDILTLIFADLTAVDYKNYPHLASKFPAFNEKMARETIKFLDNLRNKDIKLLLIHCDAGVSRSAAVGIFAVRYLGMDEKLFRKEHVAIGPNSLV